MQTKTDFLDKYKRQPFANGLIPFTGAVRVIGEPFVRISAKEAGRQRWVVGRPCMQHVHPQTDVGADLRQENEGCGCVQPRGDDRVNARHRDG